MIEDDLRRYAHRMNFQDEDVIYLLDLIACAVAEEREACAQIAQRWPRQGCIKEAIAAAIRSRGA